MTTKIDLKIEKKETPSQKAYKEIERLFGGKEALFKFIINQNLTKKHFLFRGRDVNFVKSNIDMTEFTVWAVDEDMWEQNLTTFKIDLAKSDIQMFDWKDYPEFFPNSDGKEFAEFLKQLFTIDSQEFNQR